MIPYIEIFGGLVLLLFSGDILVRGAVALAQRFSIPPLIIGTTIIGFGTSLPELVCSLQAALSNASEMALGNVVGSNIANILLVVGLAAIVNPVLSNIKKVTRNMAIMLLASLAFIALAFMGEIGFWAGAGLFIGLIAYLTYSYFLAKSSPEPELAVDALAEFDLSESYPHSTPVTLAMVLGGLVALPLSAYFLIEGAIQVATDFGISKATIGLTLIAIGTSLPELATALAASIRRHGDVVVGNIIGSNIFNILAIIGITAMVVPVDVPPAFLAFDFWVMLGASLFLLLFILFKRPIGRPSAALMLVAYGFYIYALFLQMSAINGTV